ncbi:MAG: RHS repeat-associated core domain-containing protein, partial [Chloroflexota bacterium]|nr:RHS repeat-associated core domain-containing protein [Chloroflexota bacterium]
MVTGETDHLSGFRVFVTGGYTPAARVITYKYDPLGRLTGADYSSGESFEYRYDAVGNRLALTETTSLDETTVTTYTYDAANRLTSAGDVTYTWDDRGNLLSDGTFTYAYNGAGRMVRAESLTSTLVYTYTSAALSAGTADGLRVAQSVDGDVTTFAWDWASGVSEMLRDGASVCLVAHDTLGGWDGVTWVYHLPDALGSVRQVADGAGAVVSSREWTPYGVEVGAAQAGVGFTGEWWDVSVGLQYLRARWYAPGVGRFVSKDPFPVINRWLYADADPVNRVDPTGYFGQHSIARSLGVGGF